MTELATLQTLIRRLDEPEPTLEEIKTVLVMLLHRLQEQKPCKMSLSPTMLVSDIQYFFKTGTRGDSDVLNKVRERTLSELLNPPTGFREDPIYGPRWVSVGAAFRTYLHDRYTGPVPYASIQVKLMGGRQYKYDADVLFVDETGERVLQTIHVEFKYGATKLTSLPQFLSIPAKSDILPTAYHRFYYDNYLRRYLATDPEGFSDLAIPPWEEYEAKVCTIDYSVHPLFSTMYDREPIHKTAKAAIVNESIRSYLTQHAHTLDANALSTKLLTTQGEKHFAMWSPTTGTFHHAMICEADMRNLQFTRVENGNRIVVTAASTTRSLYKYHLLLRWRNHKGILMPMFQVALALAGKTPAVRKAKKEG